MTAITASLPWPTTPRPGDRHAGPRRNTAPAMVPQLAGPACAGADPELFFPESRTAAAAVPAIAICRRCQVRSRCLQGAIGRREHFGIWGGVNFENPRTLRLILGEQPAPRAEKAEKAAGPPSGPMDLARRLGALRAVHTSKKAVARAAGMGTARASMYLDLLELDPGTQARVADGTISVAAAASAVRSARALGGGRAS
jgi:WhiB family transcriptional regulator, redox-sensing transcriptional regulator